MESANCGVVKGVAVGMDAGIEADFGTGVETGRQATKKSVKKKRREDTPFLFVEHELRIRKLYRREKGK